MDPEGARLTRSRTRLGRLVTAVLRVPVGAGILFTPATKRRLALAVLGSFLTALLDTVGVAALVPLMQLLTSGDRSTGALGWIVARVGQDTSDARLAVLLASSIVVAFTAKGVLTIAFRWWQLGFIARQGVKSTTRLLRGYLLAPYSMHQERSVPDLMRVMGDAVGQTYSQVVMGTLQILSEALTLTALGVLLLVTNPGPAVVAIVYFSLLSWFIARKIRPRVERAGEEMLEYNMYSFKASLHALGGVKEIKVRHNGAYFADYFERAQRDLAQVQRRFAFLSELPKYLLEILFISGVALMTVLTFTSSDSAKAVSTLALFVAAGSRIMPSLVRMIGAVSSVRYGLPGVAMVVEDLHRYQGIPQDPGAVGAARIRGDLKFQDVRFRYPSSTDEVLRGVSLEVPRGTSLAIVGPSGAGKSTLVDLLLGLQSPTHGLITVGGVDIAEDMRGWQTSIGLVPQTVFLFDETLLENVTFGDSGAVDESRLVAALERAQLTDLVEQMPAGVYSRIGERGSRISGGQQQRIGIARALYYEPEVVVLDEATSALDNLTERKIADTIDGLHGSTTMIVVAHRLSTVRHCDQVAYLSGGRVAACGTFDEVRARNAEFAELVRLGSLDAVSPRATTIDTEGADAGYR